MYGVMLLLGIAGCIWLTGRRWVSWGGDWDLVFRVALWGVIAGVVGARAYHDITSWNQDPAIHQHWWGFAAVWDGGLGIWGAIPAGVLAGAVVVRQSGNSVWVLAVGFFVWWQFMRDRERPERPPVQKARPVPKGPRMTVPKSRVR